jgi:hypothetical protein
VEQHHKLGVKLVTDRRFRAVATCKVCKATLLVGPEAPEEHVAAYALGLSMGVELLEHSRSRVTFHLGPGCPGGSLRITVEELL